MSSRFNQQRATEREDNYPDDSHANRSSRFNQSRAFGREENHPGGSQSNRSSRLYQSRVPGGGGECLDGSQDYGAPNPTTFDSQEQKVDQSELVALKNERTKHEWRNETPIFTRSKAPRPMSYGRLRVWANTQDPNELALFMANEIEQIKEFLMVDNIKEDHLSLFVSAIGNAVVSHQNAAVKKILDVVCKTSFLEKHLTAFVLGKIESEKSLEGKSFLKSMICILENILKHCPQQAVKCITVIPQLRNINGFSDWNDIGEKILQVERKAKQTFMSSRDKSRETAPDDFLESSVLPTTDDLKEDVKVFLRPAKVKGGYDDTRHYLDVQFRLLKQDYIIPLRHGIAEFKKSGLQRNFKTQDIRLYFDVHILGIVRQDFIDHVVQFDVSKLMAVKWEFSKRFITGSLLLFSKDGFETFAIATVANRDQEDLKKGFVNVNFKTGFDLVFNSTSNDEYVMAETVAYYESYCHVLEGLKEMVDNLPLQEYIVKCEKKVKPPQYLLHMPDLSYDLSPLMKRTRTPKIVPVLLSKEWPQAELMSLNESQRDAAQIALTKSLAVIQGPPGTGKTYVGLKVVQTLLKNRVEAQSIQDGLSPTQRNGSPILVVCFTNHALDQFLEGILDFCPEGIVRVGGRSNSEKLEPYNLKEIEKKQLPELTVLKARKECQKSLKEVADRINQASKKLESSFFRIFSQKSLEQFMKENHFTSLTSMESNFMGRDSILSQWLNAKVEDPERAVNEIIDCALIRLILLCKMKKIPHRDLDKGMAIQERASLYMYYVLNLRTLLRKEKDELQPVRDHPSVKRTIENVNHILEKSFNQILTDNILQKAVPKEYLNRIQAICHKDGKVVKNETFKVWLGFWENEQVKLDFIEQLQNNFSGTAVETGQIHEIKDDNLGIFVDGENATELYKQQTNSLKNSLTSKVHRVLSLGLGETEVYNDASDEKWQRAGKPLGFSQITKKLRNVKPMSETMEEKIKNVWAIGLSDRFALYKRWVERYKSQIIDEMQEHVREYESLQRAYREIKDHETGCILREANVIGMTTTGAAKHRSVLQEVGCKIIVVEEAAEVLEAHIVTALNKKCEHLVLIGDHQQLRPNPCVYELAKKFDMEISLFERLVKNQFPHKVLLEQHRMRPQISRIMRHIYPDLQDHPAVESYDHIKGVAKDVFLIQHEELETNIVDSHSKANDFEANYVIRLCQYLLLQGYEPKQITILATYGGQVTNIRTRVTEDSMESEVHITAVDNFQGEENDIIILSLVRSNEEDNVGFLKVNNRVCVALSRAKMGLYIIGNFKQFSSQSDLWKSIIQTAEIEEIIGGGLPVVCPNHPDKGQMQMHRDTDFDKRPEGGCGVACGAKLNCGHICELKCHGYDPNHDEYKCKKPCTKSCELGHPCNRYCYQECGDCQFKIKKIIPLCGHEDDVPCHLPPHRAVCCQPCPKTLDCGHQCDGQCGHCRVKSNHNACRAIVEHTWPCGHHAQVECFKKHLPCPHPCNTQLDCGHKCKGTCGTCLQGKIHQICQEKCKKKLLCGHLCKAGCGEPCSPCKEPCPFSCRHGSCMRSDLEQSPNCGHMCPPCKEKCLRNCPCRYEYGTCHKLCSQECNSSPCQKACERTLKKCGHKCRGICGEICVCIECKKIESLNGEFWAKTDVDEDMPTNVLFNEDEQKFKTWQKQELRKPLIILIPTCNHVFYIEELDRYVEQFEPGGSSYISCPKCKHPIQRCTRYETENLERAVKRYKLKEMLVKDSFISPELIKRLEKCKSLLLDSKLMNEFIALRIDKDVTKSKMEAMSFQFKLAFVLCQISSFRSETASDSALEKMLLSRKDALLKINNYVTQQQKREFILDFAHCMFKAVVDKIKTIRKDACNVCITDIATSNISSTDIYVDKIKREIDSAIVESKEIIGQNMVAAAQLKLIEKSIYRAVKVLKSKDDELLQDIIRDPILPISKPAKSQLLSHTDKLIYKRGARVCRPALDKKVESMESKVQFILNRLTPTNFEGLYKEMLDLKIADYDQLQNLVQIIFDRATLEPMFVEAYARLCKKMKAIKVTPPKGMKENQATFRVLLLTKCQTEFEMDKSVIFEDPEEKQKQLETELPEGPNKRSQIETELQFMKLRRLKFIGNTRFIGELFKLNMLTENILHDCIFRLLKARDDASLLCLCQLLTSIGQLLDTDRAKARMDQYFTLMTRLMKEKQFRIKFALKDVIELRANNWIPRKEQTNVFARDIYPEQQRRQKSQQDPPPAEPAKWKSSILRRPFKSGGRDKSEERPSASSSVRLSQTLAAPLPITFGCVKKCAQMTEKEMENTAKNVMNEYLSSGDLKEAKLCIMLLKGQKYLQKFITASINIVLEGTDCDRKATGQFFLEIIKDRIISLDKYLAGLSEVLPFVEDMSIDVPKIWTNLAQLITPVLVEGSMPWSNLKQLIAPTLTPLCCSKFLAEILITATSMVSDADVAKMWHSSGIAWETFLPADKVASFIQDNNLAFVMKTQVSWDIACNDLVKIIKKSTSNDDIYSFIMADVLPEIQGTSFVRLLMTAFTRASLSKIMRFTPDVIRSGKDVLQKYIEGPDMEMQALFAIQALMHHLEHPRNVISEVFETLYNEEVINEEVFKQWEVSTEEPEGKGLCSVAVRRFMSWMR